MSNQSINSANHQEKELKCFAMQIRKSILHSFSKTHTGHIGGSMSIAEVLAVLYGSVMRIDPKNPQWQLRDRFVLSKGHNGPALYATLAEKGYFSRDVLPTLNEDNTTLPSHCDMNRVAGVDMTTGSLGQGMSTALGLAWGLRYQKIDANVYLILGDGECDEGQVWEGALFASTNAFSINSRSLGLSQRLRLLTSDSYSALIRWESSSSKTSFFAIEIK